MPFDRAEIKATAARLAHNGVYISTSKLEVRGMDWAALYSDATRISRQGGQAALSARLPQRTLRGFQSGLLRRTQPGHYNLSRALSARVTHDLEPLDQITLIELNTQNLHASY